MSGDVTEVGTGRQVGKLNLLLEAARPCSCKLQNLSKLHAHLENGYIPTSDSLKGCPQMGVQQGVYLTADAQALLTFPLCSPPSLSGLQSPEL